MSDKRNLKENLVGITCEQNGTIQRCLEIQLEQKKQRPSPAHTLSQYSTARGTSFKMLMYMASACSCRPSFPNTMALSSNKPVNSAKHMLMNRILTAYFSIQNTVQQMPSILTLDTD